MCFIKTEDIKRTQVVTSWSACSAVGSNVPCPACLSSIYSLLLKTESIKLRRRSSSFACCGRFYCHPFSGVCNLILLPARYLFDPFSAARLGSRHVSKSTAKYIIENIVVEERQDVGAPVPFSFLLLNYFDVHVSLESLLAHRWLRCACYLSLSVGSLLIDCHFTRRVLKFDDCID